MVLMPSIGAPSATVTICEAVPLLPAESLTVAVIVTLPCASAEITLAGTPMLQLPLASSTVVYVDVPIVTETVLPVVAPVAEPLIICACPCSVALMMSSPATVLMVTTGAARSTVRLCVAEAGFPALSLTAALTVYELAVRLAKSPVGTLTLQLPSACTLPL